MSLNLETIAARVLSPGRFFVAPPGGLRVEQVLDEEVPWELFLGHLLPPQQTRQRQRFASWHLHLDRGARAEAPLVSLRWQQDESKLYVTRQILTHTFEAYEDPPGVIQSRPAERWLPELVGAIDLAHGGEHLNDELATLVFQAVIGASRLPITSVESPLPAYSLGWLAYSPSLPPGDAVCRTAPDWLSVVLNGEETSQLERAKALETALRATGSPDIGTLADALHPSTEPAALLITLFNTVALSPYTQFANNLVALVERLADRASFGMAAAADVVSYMLRHLCRHLTAFDLSLFHNFGANYPDALFLDALLRAYVRLIERQPALFLDDDAASRVRRRALVQGVLLRRHYEGHRVPDTPTSLGENARVLPEPFVRVPQEQIVEAGRRRRKLFENEPIADLLQGNVARVWAKCLDRLADVRELRELGMAVFLDRPLGAHKQPGEADRTPLLSYAAFSRHIARSRLTELLAAGWIDKRRHSELSFAIDRLLVPGVPVRSLFPIERPGVVSIADALKAAPDFVLLRTTRGSLAQLLAQLDLNQLEQASPPTAQWLASGSNVLLVQRRASPSDPPTLAAFNDCEPRLELGFPERPDYFARRGIELPVRLRVLSIREPAGDQTWHNRDDVWGVELQPRP